MPKPIKLSVIRNQAKREDAKHVRRSLFLAARQTCGSRGDELSGFILVAWDKEGTLRTSVLEGPPFARPFLPYLFRDAIHQQQSAELASAGAFFHIDPDDDNEGA